MPTVTTTASKIAISANLISSLSARVSARRRMASASRGKTAPFASALTSTLTGDSYRLAPARTDLGRAAGLNLIQTSLSNPNFQGLPLPLHRKRAFRRQDGLPQERSGCVPDAPPAGLHPPVIHRAAMRWGSIGLRGLPIPQYP